MKLIHGSDTFINLLVLVGLLCAAFVLGIQFGLAL